VNVQSTTSGYAAFFAMRDAAALRMGATGTVASPSANRPTARTGSTPNISLTKPARPVDPLQAAQSNLGPIKGGRIDFIA
jgi:hypothetical protein